MSYTSEMLIDGPKSKIELDDCGKRIKLHNRNFTHRGYDFEAEVQMVIKTPKGTLAIFHNDKGYTNILDAQCEAVRTFVETHKNE